MTPPRVPLRADTTATTADVTTWTADTTWLGRFTSAGLNRTTRSQADARTTQAQADARTTVAAIR